MKNGSPECLVIYTREDAIVGVGAGFTWDSRQQDYMQSLASPEPTKAHPFFSSSSFKQGLCVTALAVRELTL